MNNINIYGFDEIIGECKMPIIVIYNSPKDFPGEFVARLWDIDKPTPYIYRAASLEKIREKIPKSLFKIPKSESDIDCIVESWL